MKISSLEATVIQTPAMQLARLSGPHGYQLDGDTVRLNAMFALLDPAAHEHSWALQLWACPSAPSSARDIAGHVVAEVPLPPMGELADETEHFEVSAFAQPPAGGAEYVMVLVLARGRAGQANEVHDFAVYPRPQLFVQPRMSGNVGYRINGARVEFDVERVENPRSEENRGGTLSLELWALPAPYTGGRFQGHHLAGVEIGSLNGQSQWAMQPIDLAFSPPPAGTWQIVLMLREWTACGFVTRDFASFAAPFVTAPAVEKTPAKEVPKTAAPVAPAKEVAKNIAPVALVAPAKEITKSVVRVAPAAPIVSLARVVPSAPAAPVKAPVAASPKGVSVNTARVEELAAVNGLTQKLAEGIVKKRPFVSLDDLRKVKGLGEKVLAKIRSSLRL